MHDGSTLITFSSGEFRTPPPYGISPTHSRGMSVSNLGLRSGISPSESSSEYHANDHGQVVDIFHPSKGWIATVGPIRWFELYLFSRS